MFFILSKALVYFLTPFNWILILAIWYFFTKNTTRKKRIIIAGSAILIIFSNPFIYNKFTYWWQVKQPDRVAAYHYNAGIVLGGFSNYDKHGTGYFNKAGDRFTQVLKLYNQGIIKKIVMTGGSASILHDDPAEATFAQKEFLANKVKSEDLIIEDKSRNTYENAIFTKHILDSLHVEGPFMLVTSATHMRRAELVFTKAGMSVIPYPANFEVIDKRLDWDDYIIPDVSLLNDWKIILKEMVGLLVYKITGKG